ncbi:MAG: peptidylprolyl isomerase [Pedobacter sp.]|nr:MAG: peptidylprolyl isomerase [Pedobacter sp.]
MWNMLKNAFLAMCVLLSMAVVSCEKPEVYNRETQLKLDVDSITRFLKANNIAAMKDDSGLFSQVLLPGSGNITLEPKDRITVTYTGRLLNGVVVERLETPDSLLYSGAIKGWRLGLKKIQPGGRIRLIIPSSLAYTNRRVGIIPPNSNLDYTIDLIKVTKYIDPKTK